MKTRMSLERRGLLHNYSAKVVTAPANLQTEIDNHSNWVNKLVKDWMRAKFPQHDMQVLARYKCASPDYCVKFKAPERPVVGWTFPQDEPDMPLMPHSAHTYSRPVHELDSTEIPDAIASWEKAQDRRDDMVMNLRGLYLDLIRSARYVEDIFEVWPEARAIERDLIPQSNLPMALSDDTVKAIKADMARRGVGK